MERIKQVTISSRVDADDKARFEQFCESVGLNASSAINIFIKTVLRRHEIPFLIQESAGEL